MRLLSSLKEGEVFKVKDVLIDQNELFLEKMGKIAEFELLQNDLFGFIIVKCQGAKYAINKIIANKISVLPC